jgi:hypothetical protein
MVVLLTVAVTLVAVIEGTSQTKAPIGVSQALALILITPVHRNVGGEHTSTTCNGLHPDLVAVVGNKALTLPPLMGHKLPIDHILTMIQSLLGQGTESSLKTESTVK